jgi:hypothetical protein
MVRDYHFSILRRPKTSSRPKLHDVYVGIITRQNCLLRPFMVFDKWEEVKNLLLFS